jgi:hypothetical protein
MRVIADRGGAPDEAVLSFLRRSASSVTSDSLALSS